MNFYNRHFKKFLVVIGIILMLAFLLPSTFMRGGPSAGDVGELDGESVTVNDLANQHNAFVRLLQVQVTAGSQPVALPLYIFGPQVTRQFSDDPLSWYLAVHEAEQNAVIPTEAEVDQVVNGFRLKLDIGNVSTDLAALSANDQAAYRQSIRMMLAVSQNFVRTRAGLLVSEPLVDSRLNPLLQQIDLRVIPFDAAPLVEKAPAPDAARLQKLFDQHAATPPEQADAKTNPLGFGYRVPDRVKLQVWSVPEEAVRQYVVAQHDPYYWDKEAYKYYLQHPEDFATEDEKADETKPADPKPGDPKPGDPSSGETRSGGDSDKSAGAQASATQVSATQASTTPVLTTPVSTTQALETQPATAPAGTQPKVKPFEAVKPGAMQLVLNPIVLNKQKAVQNKLLAKLQGDFRQWQKSTAASKPVDLDVTTYAYVKQAADAIEKQTGVRPTTADYTDKFYDQEAVRGLGGVGSSFFLPGDTRNPFAGIKPYGSYLFEAIAPLTGATAQVEQTTDPLTGQPTATGGGAGAGGPTLVPYQPSTVTTNKAGGYITRVTAVDASHAPKDLAQVRPAVERDAKIDAAYNKATDEATAALAKAKAAGWDALSTAGDSISLGYLSLNGPTATLEALKLSADDVTQFKQEAFDLLRTDSPNAKPPFFGVVQLPADRKVFLVSAADVRLDPQVNSEEDVAIIRQRLASQIAQEAIYSGSIDRDQADSAGGSPNTIKALVAWMDTDALIARTGFKPSVPRSRKGPTPPPPSNFPFGA